MKETGSPKLLFENLDLTPIHPTLWKDLHREGPGRPVEYQPEWDLRALMLRQLLEHREDRENAETAFRALFRLTNAEPGRPKYPEFTWENAQIYVERYVPDNCLP